MSFNSGDKGSMKKERPRRRIPKSRLARWNRGRRRPRPKLGRARRLRARRRRDRAWRRSLGAAVRRERPVRSERGPKGDAPPIRKVEVESLSRVTQQCARCMTPRMANALVTYEHFHRGQWKRARRMRCARHASKFAKKHRG